MKYNIIETGDLNILKYLADNLGKRYFKKNYDYEITYSKSRSEYALDIIKEQLVISIVFSRNNKIEIFQNVTEDEISKENILEILNYCNEQYIIGINELL